MGCMKSEDDHWEGTPCILPEWIYSASSALFEVRQAIKRLNSSYYTEIFGGDESEGAEILKMIQAARTISNSARMAERELVIEAHARGMALKEIGVALDMKESGVSMYLKRAALTAERQLEITRELQASATLAQLWDRDIEETDQPGESLFRYGVERLVTAKKEYDQSIELYQEGSDLDSAARKLNSAFNILHSSYLSLTDPQIPQVIERHAPRSPADEDTPPEVIRGALTTYIRHAIFAVVLATAMAAEALDKAANGQSDSVAGCVQLVGRYMEVALVSMNRPEAMFIFQSCIAFLRQEYPDLLPSQTLSTDQIMTLADRRFGSDGPHRKKQ
jgi:DNA-binding CsgD family transcriptional regulator